MAITEVQQLGCSGITAQTHVAKARVLVVDTDNYCVRVHDGVTAGGHKLVLLSEVTQLVNTAVQEAVAIDHEHDAEDVGDTAFSNPPNDLTEAEKKAVLSAICAVGDVDCLAGNTPGVTQVKVLTKTEYANLTMKDSQTLYLQTEDN